MNNRIYFLISIPEEFQDKFVSFLRNLNTVNINGKVPIIIESVYGKKKQIAVIPKTEEVIDVGTGTEKNTGNAGNTNSAGSTDGAYNGREKE